MLLFTWRKEKTLFFGLPVFLPPCPPYRGQRMREKCEHLGRAHRSLKQHQQFVLALFGARPLSRAFHVAARRQSHVEEEGLCPAFSHGAGASRLH